MTRQDTMILGLNFMAALCYEDKLCVYTIRNAMKYKFMKYEALVSEIPEERRELIRAAFRFDPAFNSAKKYGESKVQCIRRNTGTYCIRIRLPNSAAIIVLTQISVIHPDLDQYLEPYLKLLSEGIDLPLFESTVADIKLCISDKLKKDKRYLRTEGVL